MIDLQHPSNWKYESPESEGFHRILDPENSACKVTWIFRLNLRKGNTFSLSDKKLELNGVVVMGKLEIVHGNESSELNKLDSFFLPGGEVLELRAMEDCFVFIGGSLCNGSGVFLTRQYDLSLPLGEIHQVHGKPPYRREVFMTIAQQDKASRLICGITCGDPGMWTSWPPHQHTRDLEEVYCYFDIAKPASAFHFASRVEGKFEFIHPVSSGDCIAVPEGYHPTCGMPGVSSSYFWVMAAHDPERRRYDLAVDDPNFIAD